MRAVALLVLLLPLAGCIRVDATHIGTGPNGGEMYRITCNQSLSVCYDEAKERCPRGFTPMSEGGDSRDVKIGNDTATCEKDYAGRVTCEEHPGQTARVFDGAIVVECQ